MTLIGEYRAYRQAFRYWSRGTKGVEAIMKLPERQRDGIVELLVGMRQAQGLPFDEESVIADMKARDDEDAEDEF